MWILLFLVFGTKFTGISQKSRWHSNPCHNQIDKVCNEILFVLSIADYICESISKNVTMWIIINNNKRTITKISGVHLNLSSKQALKGRLWTHHKLQITHHLFKTNLFALFVILLCVLTLKRQQPIQAIRKPNIA
jgi:hypothetical protein